MRILLTLLLLTILSGCHPPRVQFNPSGNDNINQIVKAIIDDKDNYFKDPLPLSIDLFKITVANLPLDSALSIGSIPIAWVLSLNHPEHFNPKDSLYILSQNTNLKSFKLDRNSFSNISLTTAAQQSILKSPRFYYEISIPIFSADKRKAYVEMNKHCEMCGKGYTFYLEKKDDEWIIVWRELRWMS